MAIQIPIWPGSSSFSPGMTPFGFFDNDVTFQEHADKVSTWSASRLGYPISDIELQDIHFYTCFEEAVLEYSNQVNQFAIRDNMINVMGTESPGSMTGKPIVPNFSRIIALSKQYGTEAGSGGNITYKTASLDIVKDTQVYSFSELNLEDPADSGKSIEIRKVLHNAPPAIVRYFDPYVGTGLGSQQLLENFGWGSYSPGVSFLMMPMYADLLRLQAIEFNDQIRKSGYSFSITGDRFRIFPIPTYNFKVYFHYITGEDRNSSMYDFFGTDVIGDISNAPYGLHTYTKINTSGRQWIFKYTLALVKEVLGNIRNKYSSIPIPESDVTLNGGDLISQAQTEQTELIEQLRENLEAISRSSQLTKLSEESDALQEQLNKIPMSIYIG